MSLFCFLSIDGMIGEKSKKYFYQQIEKIAQKYDCTISDTIKWHEPIMLAINEGSYIISINDSEKVENCELFLLPDGWYYNNKTNTQPFISRAGFFEEVSKIVIKENCIISFYMAQSGTEVEEFENVILNQSEIALFLYETIGQNGVDTGIHIKLK